MEHVENRDRGIERWRHLRSKAPPSDRIFIFASYTKTMTDRRKMSMDHLSDVGAKESNGDVISVLGRHLADKFTFSQSHENHHQRTDNVNWTLIGNRGRGTKRWRHFRSKTPPSGRIYICENYAKNVIDKRKMSMEHLKEIGVRNPTVTSVLV